jgi:hypothetical protein
VALCEPTFYVAIFLLSHHSSINLLAGFLRMIHGAAIGTDLADPFHWAAAPGFSFQVLPS